MVSGALSVALIAMSRVAGADGRLPSLATNATVRVVVLGLLEVFAYLTARSAAPNCAGVAGPVSVITPVAAL